MAQINDFLSGAPAFLVTDHPPTSCQASGYRWWRRSRSSRPSQTWRPAKGKCLVVGCFSQKKSTLTYQRKGFYRPQDADSTCFHVFFPKMKEKWVLNGVYKMNSRNLPTLASSIAVYISLDRWLAWNKIQHCMPLCHVRTQHVQSSLVFCSWCIHTTHIYLYIIC